MIEVAVGLRQVQVKQFMAARLETSQSAPGPGGQLYFVKVN